MKKNIFFIFIIGAVFFTFSCKDLAKNNDLEGGRGVEAKIFLDHISFSSLAFFKGAEKRVYKNVIEKLNKTDIRLNFAHREITLSSFNDLKFDSLVLSQNKGEELGKISYHKSGISYPVLHTNSQTVHVYLQIDKVSYVNFCDKIKEAAPTLKSLVEIKGSKIRTRKRVFTVGKVLGKGGEGSVFEIKENPKNLAIKFSRRYGRDLGGLIYTKFYSKQAPSVHYLFKSSHTEAFIMDKVSHFVYSSENAQKIIKHLEALHAHGIFHTDINPGNIMMKDGEPVFIDHGSPSSAGALGYSANLFNGAQGDVVALARTLLNEYYKDTTRQRVLNLLEKPMMWWDKAAEAQVNSYIRMDKSPLAKSSSAYAALKKEHKRLDLVEIFREETLKGLLEYEESLWLFNSWIKNTVFSLNIDLYRKEKKNNYQDWQKKWNLLKKDPSSQTLLHRNFFYQPRNPKPKHLYYVCSALTFSNRYQKLTDQVPGLSQLKKIWDYDSSKGRKLIRKVQRLVPDLAKGSQCYQDPRVTMDRNEDVKQFLRMERTGKIN